MVGTKKSKYYKILVSIIWTIFMGWVYCFPAHGQETELLPREDTVRQVSHWQTVVQDWSQQLDSVKRRLTWVKSRSDTLFIDSALLFFTDAKNRIVQVGQQVRKASMEEEVIRKKEHSTDSAQVLEIEFQDSVYMQVAGLADTLERIENNINRLLVELDYLYESTQRRRRELTLMSTAPPPPRLSREQIFATVQKNWIKDGASTAYFTLPSWSSRLFIIILSLAYFYWIYKLGKKISPDPDELRLHKNEPLWVPILKTLIFFLILLPFSSFTVPVFVLQISYLLIFVFLYLTLYKELSPFKRWVNAWILLYYILTLIGNLLLSELWWSQAVAVCSNLAGIILVWSLGRRTDVDNPVGYLRRYVRIIIIIGHLLSISLILMGYLHVSRMCSLVVAIGLLQGLSLRAFRDMLVHDVEKEYEYASDMGWIRRFDGKQLLISVDRFIRVCCTLLIGQVLINCLHLTRETAMIVDRLLNTSHRIGNITFSYGNLLLAVLVIWLANWLQSNIKKLVEGPASQDKHTQRMALFPLFRLLIIVIGFLIGISILGLGIDKLTVIIGALSVGIGLGLQNIINNFVSGIILVFEKPFKIGDYVELADKKGQVLQIGIRSSTLLTDQGARVIIPNGDLLSGRLVNWTFSDADIRVNMNLTLEKKIPIEESKELLYKKIQALEEVDTHIPIKIWTQDITADSYIISLQVGIKHVQLIEKFRSRFLESLQQDMDTREIKITSN